MKVRADATDDAILAELGLRLAQRRIDLGLTQSDLAREAGVSKRTVERVESGASVQLTNLVRMLRSVDLLHALDGLVPAQRDSPIELLKRTSKTRKRVSRRHRVGQADRTWKWSDDS